MADRIYYPFYSDGTNDGHGGHALLHFQQMKRIAEQVAEKKIYELVPEIAKEIYNQSLTNLMSGLTKDVETYVTVSIEDTKNIINESKCRKVITDNIMKCLKENLKDIEIKL